MTKKTGVILVICTVLILISVFAVSFSVTKYQTQEVRIENNTSQQWLPETTQEEIQADTVSLPEYERVYRRNVAFNKVQEISGWEDWACNKFLDTMEAGDIKPIMILMGSNNEKDLNIVTFAVYDEKGDVYYVETNFSYSSIRKIKKDSETIYKDGQYTGDYKKSLKKMS